MTDVSYDGKDLNINFYSDSGNKFANLTFNPDEARDIIAMARGMNMTMEQFFHYAIQNYIKHLEDSKDKK